MLIYRPVESRVLSSQDYKAGELITHSQSARWIVGHSDLAQALIKGIDPHAAFAARLLRIDLKDFNKKIVQHANARQAGKPFNFSKPGGGSVPTVVQQQRKQGEDTPHPEGPSWIDDGNGNLVRGFKGMRFCTLMRGEYCGGRDGKHKAKVWGSGPYARPITPTCISCLECGRELEQIWKEQWTENPPYFDYVQKCVKHGMLIEPKMLDRWPWLREVYHDNQQLEPTQIMQHWSGRLRKVSKSAETPFCVIANTLFQGLLADAARLAHRICTRECYDVTYRVPDMLFHNSKRSAFTGGPSPLYGSTLPIFAHDELIGDHPASVGHEASLRISEVMVATLRYLCPDVADAVEVDQTLMPAWHKAASKVIHRGRVVPWTPEHNSKTCAECEA